MLPIHAIKLFRSKRFKSDRVQRVNEARHLVDGTNCPGGTCDSPPPVVPSHSIHHFTLACPSIPLSFPRHLHNTPPLTHNSQLLYSKTLIHEATLEYTVLTIPTQHLSSFCPRPAFPRSSRAVKSSLLRITSPVELRFFAGPPCFKRRLSTSFLISTSIRRLIRPGCSNSSITKPTRTRLSNRILRWSPNSMPKSRRPQPQPQPLNNNTILV